MLIYCFSGRSSERKLRAELRTGTTSGATNGGLMITNGRLASIPGRGLPADTPSGHSERTLREEVSMATDDDDDSNEYSDENDYSGCYLVLPSTQAT